MQDFGSGVFLRHRGSGALLTMAALDYLHQAGLAFELKGERLRSLQRIASQHSDNQRNKGCPQPSRVRGL